MENLKIEFEIKNTTDINIMQLNTLILLVRELSKEMSSCHYFSDDYLVMNDTLERIQAEAENMKIKVIDYKEKNIYESK